MNCLTVFDHFVGLALKGLKLQLRISAKYTDSFRASSVVYHTTIGDKIPEKSKKIKQN